MIGQIASSFFWPPRGRREPLRALLYTHKRVDHACAPIKLLKRRGAQRIRLTLFTSSAFPKFESYEAAFVEPVGPCLDRWSRLVSSISAMMRCLQFHGIDELATIVTKRDNQILTLRRHINREDGLVKSPFLWRWR
jgi:hypothetical protein